MSLDEFKYLLEITGAFGIGGIIFGLLVFLLVKSFIPSYLSQKASNLADKEDIAEITEKVEQVRSQHLVLLEELKVVHQLKLAAIDKRLQAHQEAFALWSEMIKAPLDGKFIQLHARCSDWWDNNCLYLDPNVRGEFLSSITKMKIHHDLISLGEESQLILADFENLFKAIIDAVQLPSLTPNELKIISKAK